MDEEIYFNYSAALRIYSESGVDFEEIENRLGQPSRKHRKGDRRGPKSPPYKHDMWSLESGIDEEENLEDHLFALWGILKPHKEYLLALKKSAKVDIFCGYRSSSHTAGVDISYRALELFKELEIDFSLSIITT
ncbi:DUF4279 domain-containing protein [Microbulbifer thermotolerans]|uniref:DUF4279 domain-containing protein n=1 Tax=Microbulbifer thermotolerans TaxID=252514 RepID=UPI0022493C72|nr:DUF4279 domain-containing protein [Microbulbifer thermotolerans]MCX2781350.1 DUF4279 domain-containing protein [Microbulbifer thermotolerans]MCX2806725.1 DUF4279 domain-containing protein [Microbulbifer thermotolerans]MCX2833194.1 DUF4279 domain-containing protein [Microbulbifer thermotolerans]